MRAIAALLAQRLAPAPAPAPASPRPPCRPPHSYRCRGWRWPVDYLTPTPEAGPVRQAPTPTPEPQTPREIVRAIWEAAGLGWEWPTVERIVQCESSWNPRATGRAGEYGLFQVHPIHRWRFDRRGFGDPYDVRANATVALEIRQESGWRPWSCAR